MRKIILYLLMLCLTLSLSPAVEASEMGEVEEYGVQLIQYYLHHREKAADVIWDLTEQMKEQDRKQGAVWEKLMHDWSWINSDMPIYTGCLPDGLPEDDSLCIVVMGFGLNEDGSMRPELLERLEVALSSARKYPNAFVMVTGGQTGEAKGVTEAGRMAAWLRKQGVAENRILEENQSLSTTANAVNCYKLLVRSCPQVTAIAVVTSDYHITQSCAMFATVSNYQAGYKGGKSLELVGNAVCVTGTEYDSLATQAWGISLIMGLPYEENTKAPKLYRVDRPVVLQTESTQPPTEAEAQEAVRSEEILPGNVVAPEEKQIPEERGISPVIPAAAAVALILFWLLIPRRPGKKHRREKPKMNWEV